MTNQEAIQILKSKLDGSVDTSYEWCECVRLAIKALETEGKVLAVGLGDSFKDSLIKTEVDGLFLNLEQEE